MTDSASVGSDWRDGYATALDYTCEFYSYLCPEHLNFACLLHGVEPPTLGRDFDYFELGCGRGSTVSTLAASNPEARFFANDFMPTHVAAGRRLAREAGLHNFTFLESSFEELCESPPAVAKFDYITMHGVYTWVSPRARAQIVRFIASHLKPGGVVALGYNAMPGWTASLPLQRLLHASTQWQVGDGLQQVQRCRELMGLLGRADAEVCRDNPMMEHRRARIVEGSASYIQHEFLNRHWEPMYHADVASDLSQAKLDYVGTANLPLTMAPLSAERQAFLDSIPDPAWRETAKDFLLGTSFRFDIFVRGRRTMAPERRQQRLGDFCIALTAPVEVAARSSGAAGGSYTALLRPMLEQLAERPRTLREFGESSTSGGGLQLSVAIASLLTYNRFAAVFADGTAQRSRASAHAWNRRLSVDAGSPGACATLASPVTGCGIELEPEALAVYAQLVQDCEAADEDICARAVQSLAAGGGNDEAAMAGRVRHILAVHRPVWHRLELL